jgi:hypothetical protein
MSRSAYEGLRDGMPNRVQILIGVFVLLCGVAVYLIDRPPDQIQFVALLPIWMSDYSSVLRLPAVASGSFPTFAHVMSFSTITAALCSPFGSRYALTCATWLFIDLIFEIGQGPGRWIAEVMPASIESPPYLIVRDYFLLGTFDVADVVAAFLGSATAFVVLLLTRDRRAKRS